MTGSLVIALILAVGAAIAEGVAYLLIFLVVLAACLLWAAYEAWREEWHRLLQVQAERDKALQRLKPKLEILTKTEVEPTQKSCRIRVESTTDTGCKFGAEIVRISPEVPGLPLPLALRLIPEAGERTEFLPARGSRTVDVVMYGADFDKQATFDDNRLVLLGVGSSGTYVLPAPGEVCRITVQAYSDQEGMGDQKEFIIETSDEPPQGPPILRAVEPDKTQVGGPAIKPPPTQPGSPGTPPAAAPQLQQEPPRV
jgi:hypothetical protein